MQTYRQTSGIFWSGVCVCVRVQTERYIDRQRDI